jgi:hypothetical protein
MGGGGGGGGGSSWGDPDDMAQKVRQLEQSAEDQAFETVVAALIGEVLAEANDRPVEAIQRHLREIEEALGKDIEGALNLMFGGSVAKRTYVAGLSDVDALVILNESELAASTPAVICDHFLQRLSERFPGRVHPDGFAITVQFADGAVQVIPVVRRGSDFLLPSEDTTSWSRVRPRAFADRLVEINRELGGKVVPVVKLAKTVLANQLAKEQRPSGYHTEALAVEILESYRGPLTPKKMLEHFFATAPNAVLRPVDDPTGQSAAVDASLGAPGSLPRLLLADRLQRIARKIKNANGAQSVEMWESILGVNVKTP